MSANVSSHGAATALLRIEQLSLRFGGLLAVNQVSFEIRQGEVFTLIGPNGAGKTTVFNLISRIYAPTSGEIYFRGQPLTEIPAHGIARLGIARTFQNIELFENATVLENLLIGANTHRISGLISDLLFLPISRRNEIMSREIAETMIELLDLTRHRHSRVAGLPYGVRKVIEIGRALCSQPKLLLLDEPSSGLNAEETDDMAWWIEDINRQLGVTILMVEHDMNLVNRVSDRVLAMNQGEVLTLGSPQDVQSHPGVIEAYLGGDLDLASLRRPA